MDKILSTVTAISYVVLVTIFLLIIKEINAPYKEKTCEK